MDSKGSKGLLRTLGYTDTAITADRERCLRMPTPQSHPVATKWIRLKWCRRRGDIKNTDAYLSLNGVVLQQRLSIRATSVPRITQTYPCEAG
jgi:hypothetical protein